jgi:hypothetical protein
MSEAPTPEPTPEPPKSLIEKIGAALPVGLTAIATVFAGMSTGALQQAMYWKSQAAQDQSKATNQWTLAGFKVDRSLIMQTTAAQMATFADNPANPFTATSALSADATAEQRATEWLSGKGPPRAYRRTSPEKDKAPPAVGLPAIESPQLAEMLDAIKNRKEESEIIRMAASIPLDAINRAIDEGESTVERITEKDWDAVVSAARDLVRAKTKDKAAGAAAQVALFEMEQRRYRSEATLNQEVGFLYEARVKITTAESDKHRKKSQQFFYAMLAAQIGATISALALAKKTGSALWLFAGLIGLASLGIGAYVFLQ